MSDSGTGNPTDWVQIATGLASVAALITLGFTFIQMRQAERWKRTEFVASLVGMLDADQRFFVVRKVLDYKGPEVVLSRHGGRSSKPMRLTDEVLTRALELPEGRQKDNEAGTASYSVTEHDVRDIFDAFFDALGRFENHVSNGLVDPEAFSPYLSYWFGQMNGLKPKRAVLHGAIARYARRYHPDAVKFLARFGVPLDADAAPPQLTDQPSAESVETQKEVRSA